MKFIFICGSLEVGKDGVGDYTRRLSAELIRKGYNASMISLNDKFIKKILLEEQAIDKINVSVLRLPSSQSFKKRMSSAKARIDKLKPEWISLQYVGFGFHKYGLPLELFRLRTIIGNANLHIMFHELWCGMSLTSKKKERALGLLQKVFLKLMVSYLKPADIFTSIEPYNEYLKKIGIKSKVIPIFSNIPFTTTCNSQSWKDLILQKEMKPLIDKSDEYLKIGMFGTLYSQFNVKEIIEAAVEAAEFLTKELLVIFMGHNRGLAIDTVIPKIDHITICNLGYLQTDLVNEVMNQIDVAIITSPVDGINKSTAAMAWLERRVPILVSSQDRSYKQENMKQGIVQVKSSKDVLIAFKLKKKLAGFNPLLNVVQAYSELSKNL